MRKLKYFLPVILLILLCGCSGNNTLEKGIEYVYAAPDGTDTATMNDIARTLTARIEAFGISEGDFDVSTKDNEIMIRLASGADYNLMQAIPALGNLTFYETYDYMAVHPSIVAADSIYANLNGVPYDSLEHQRGSVIFNFWRPTFAQAQIMNEPGFIISSMTEICNCLPKDTAQFMAVLSHDSTRICFPRNCQFRWYPVPPTKVQEPMCALIACKTGEASRLSGGKMRDVKMHKFSGMEQEITFTMDAYETSAWSRYTKENIGNTIAIDVDGIVYSYTSISVQIINGSAKITGGDEGMMRALHCVLKGGPLKSPIRYVRETMFGL